MTQVRGLVGVLVLSCAGAVVAAESAESKGRIDAVTVYRGQALVTRVVEVAGPAGLREVVVTDLPEAVIPGSIYAESANGVEVRSVQYRTRPVSEDVREEVRNLDEQIRGLQDQIEANNRHIALLGEYKAYLDRLQGFVAPTATVELTKGVLNADTLKALSTFQLEERQKVADEELKRAADGRNLQQQLDLRNRERQKLTAGSARTVREAVLFLNLQRAENNRLRVRYLVNNANWSPSYNVRSEGDQKDVKMEYHASVQQMSGEDWSDVAMTLSTATLSLVAKAPILTPLTVTLSAPQPAQQRAQTYGGYGGSGGYASQREELNRKKIQFENARNTILGNAGKISGFAATQPAGVANQVWSLNINGNNDLSLNEVAQEMQMLDLVVRGSVSTRSAKSERPALDEGVSVTYQLPGRISLPSRSDQQLIQIASMQMKAEFYKLAIPVLTSYVYNEASVTNTSQMVLLAGPVSAYLAGQFVGHGDVPTVAVGENFTVGLGIDSSMKAGRELAEKTESVQGGNRTVDFTYRLAIENFGAAPAKVRLLDRLPTAKENEVKVELVSTGKHELSKDSTYEQTERKKGILRWEVEVPGQSIGTKALAVEYKLRLEYDKQMSISGMPVVAAR